MECTIKMEKLQATKRCRSSSQYLPSMAIQFLLRVVLMGMLLSSPHWLLILCSSLKLFFLSYCRIVSGPKFIFIVSNIIIIFLIGESRRSRSSSSSSARPDIYDEYVKRSQNLQSAVAGTVVEVKEKESIAVEPVLVEESKSTSEMAGEEMEKECEATVETVLAEEEILVEEVKDEVEREEEEGEGLVAEELNRRVEEFIAKVNLQRRMEVKMLLGN
ncbi:hypothetical protein Cni_G10444 [Canna indica]|uniref:DUF4408 domain-containing protein n=1 Tax=Canna indica TaxID=4628 RepID=A0AAQ3K7Q0_9LILI|nr:hypothetical protein Cni_G10444 [Canna indica]